ncbi:hypothetical protein AAG570_002252 [Ranatra chinensis]|uniref:Uncharacterized protein n=1 Tax=Ranatra chinensis TaxID=642074 RepID=A0ABD0Y705_9HEMI
MASNRRNMFYQNKKQEATEIAWAWTDAVTANKTKWRSSFAGQQNGRLSPSDCQVYQPNPAATPQPKLFWTTNGDDNGAVRAGGHFRSDPEAGRLTLHPRGKLDHANPH